VSLVNRLSISGHILCGACGAMVNGGSVRYLYKMNQKETIAEQERTILYQSDIIRKFGDELLYFQRQKGNVLFEMKLKKYRDEIVELKKRIKELTK